VKKLLWLEYTDCGPLIATKPFEIVDFEVRALGWDPDSTDMLMQDILPEVEIWRPDILVFWMSMGY
jgi:hypothetical protein